MGLALSDDPKLPANFGPGFLADCAVPCQSQKTYSIQRNVYVLHIWITNSKIAETYSICILVSNVSIFIEQSQSHAHTEFMKFLKTFFSVHRFF